MDDDLVTLHRQGIEVDNDNDPAPENIFFPTEDGAHVSDGWGFDGIDQWHAHGCAILMKPKFKNVSTS